MCANDLEMGSSDVFLSWKGSKCEDVLSKITLLDKTFNVLIEGPALRSPMSLAIIEGAVVAPRRAWSCCFASGRFT